MNTTKMIVGIISVVLAMLVLFQSCGAGVVDAIQDKGGTSGISGIYVAVIILIAGIVAIATRKSRGASIFCMILYIIAGVLGISSQGVYGDLKVWAILCFVFAAIFLIATLTQKKRKIKET